MRFYTLLASSLLLAAPAFGAAITYVDGGLPVAIPDNVPAGVDRNIVVSDLGTLTAVSLILTFNPNHTWAGDLIITLSDGTVTADILRRIGGETVGGLGDSTNLGGPYEFIDSGADLGAAVALLDTSGVLASGSYQASTNIFSGVDATTNPAVLLNSLFAGRNSNATWTLNISDNAAADTGSLAGWSLTLTTADSDGGAVPEPTTFGLAALGLLGTFVAARRRRQIGSR